MAAVSSARNLINMAWNILIIDDDEDDYFIAREMLNEAKGRKFDIHWAATYDAGMEELFSNHYHAVLVDYDMGSRSGIELIREANERGYSSPLILFTGRGGYEIDVEAMQAGAALYLTKDEANPLLLERSIRYAIELKQKEQSLRESETALRRSEAKMRAVFQALSEGVVFLNTNGVVEEINRSVQYNLGHTLNELVDPQLDPRSRIIRPDGSLFPVEEQPAIVAMRTGQSVRDVEMGVPTRDGKINWRLVNAEPVYDDQGILIGAVTSLFDITDRKQAEEARQKVLAEAEKGRQTLDALMEYIPEGITIADGPDVTIRVVSRYGQEILGGAHDQKTAERVANEWKVYDQDGITPLPTEKLPLVRAIQRGEVVRNQDLVQINAQGQKIYLSCNAGPIRDADGNITGGVVAWREISESKEAEKTLKQAEDTLRESEERFRRAVKSAPYPLMIRRNDGQVVMVNDAWAEITGYTLEDIPTIAEWSKKAYPERATQTQEIIFNEGFSQTPKKGWGEFEVTTSRGEKRIWDFSTAPLGLDHQGWELVLSMAVDVTERKRAENALQKSEEKFAKAFQASPIALAISTIEGGRFIEINDSYAELYGYSREEVIGHTSLELGIILPEDRKEVIAKFRQGSGFRNVELRARAKSGEIRNVLFSTEPIEIDGKEYMLSVVTNITDQKKSEQALRASEARLREILKSTHDQVFILDRDWRFQYVNQRFAATYQVSETEYIGKTIWEVFPRYLGSTLEQQYRKVMEERAPVHFEIGSAYNGDWYAISAYPTQEGISVFAADRTEEKKAQETLRQLSQAVEQSPACVVITDLSGKIEYVNPKFTQLTGYTSEEAYGQNPKILKSGQTPREVYQQLWDTIRAGKQWQGEFCNRKKNGELYWEFALVSPIIDQDGTVTHFVAVKEDITERKRAEQALHEAHNYATWMARFPEENPNPVVRVSAEGVVLYRNLPAGELPGWKCAVGQPIPGPLQALVAQAMAQSEEVLADVHLDEKYYSISVMPFPEEQYANVYGRDITERRQAEEALAQSAIQLERSNRELEQFAFVASHDLQEPLRKVIMFGGRVRDHLGDTPNETVTDYLNRMQDAARRMQVMINGLLELSRVNTRGSAFVPLDLNGVVAEVVDDLEARIRSANGQVIIENLPSIEGDEIQIRGLFLNLIGNALKFHQPAVPPVVRVAGTIERAKKPAMVEIWIEDNGIGFEQEHAERIFQPFQRLHGRSEYEGTGLGLSICQKIVERHRGSIEVKSAPEKGTTFTIRLPLEQP